MSRSWGKRLAPNRLIVSSFTLYIVSTLSSCVFKRKKIKLKEKWELKKTQVSSSPAAVVAMPEWKKYCFQLIKEMIIFPLSSFFNEKIIIFCQKGFCDSNEGKKN